MVAETTTESTSSTPKRFDASAHLRKIRTRQGMSDYLDVKWRMAWLRAEHPEAQVITEMLRGDEEMAIFKCTITIIMDTIVGIDGGTQYIDFPGKYEDRVFAVSTGHGSETREDFPDYLEKAETKAIGRACAVLGYGTDTAADFDDGEPMDGRAAAKDERKDRSRDRDAEGAATQHQINERQAWYEELRREGQRIRVGFTNAMSLEDVVRRIRDAGGTVTLADTMSNAEIRAAVIAAIKAIPTPDTAKNRMQRSAAPS